MSVSLPWQYFAATGLLFLAVVVVVTLRPALKLAPTRRGWEFWRTTPVFLASLGGLLVLSSWWVVSYYSQLGSPAEPYLVGIYACLVGVLISVATAILARRGRSSRKASKRG
jgi:hypothetical protein